MRVMRREMGYLKKMHTEVMYMGDDVYKGVCSAFGYTRG